MTHEELCRMEQSKLIKLIDEGRLIYLHCKVGDKIYFKSYFSDNIQEAEITEISLDRFGFKIKAIDVTESTRRFNCEDLGTKFFLTLEEAEKALKEREKNG